MDHKKHGWWAHDENGDTLLTKIAKSDRFQKWWDEATQPSTGLKMKNLFPFAKHQMKKYKAKEKE